MISLDVEKCNGCKSCSKVCPHLVFRVRDNKATLAFEERCIECGACELNCQSQAISVTKGTGCLWIIFRDDILKLKNSSWGT